MNFLEMQAEVRERLGERTEDFHLDTRIQQYLNEAQTRWCSEEKWPWLYTVQSDIPIPAGTNVIELIDDVVVNRHLNLRLREAGVTKPIDPQRVSVEKGFELESTFYQNDVPRWWYPATSVVNTYESGDPIALAQTIRLVPTTNVDLTAEYLFLRNPAAMALDEDQPDLPDAYHDAVVSRATAMMWLKEMDHQVKAGEQFELYGDVLRQAKEHLKRSDRAAGTWGKDAPEPTIETLGGRIPSVIVVP